jgi:hypothetical protein
MTDDKLKEIEARIPKHADAWGNFRAWGDAYCINGPNTMVIGRMLKEEDARFICAAAADIRALLAEVRALRQNPTVRINWTRSAVDQCWIFDSKEYNCGVYVLSSGRFAWFIDDKKLNRCLYQGNEATPDEAKQAAERAFNEEINPEQQ